jgi:hypothetical protein
VKTTIASSIRDSGLFLYFISAIQTIRVHYQMYRQTRIKSTTRGRGQCTEARYIDERTKQRQFERKGPLLRLGSNCCGSSAGLSPLAAGSPVPRSAAAAISSTCCKDKIPAGLGFLARSSQERER